MTEEDKPIEFPQYQPPGTPVADHKQAAPLTKLVNKMMKPKLKTRLVGRPRTKGLESDMKVHIKHKKVRFY